MAVYNRIGIKFSLKDWKALFQKDTWFIWQTPGARDAYVIRRLTLWNVFKWYFYQAIIKLIGLVFIPICKISMNYLDNIEGSDLKTISGRMMSLEKTDPKWFRLDKN